MSTKLLIAKLASTDELQNWGHVAAEFGAADKKAAFESAVPIWVKRMIKEWKLLLHPKVIDQLQAQGWLPTELQKKMIWASIVCKLDAPHQKIEKARIRKLLQKKYSNQWWEDVFKRAGDVWPAWDRARKNVFSSGPGTLMMAAHSSLVGQALFDQYKAALRMVPDT